MDWPHDQARPWPGQRLPFCQYKWHCYLMPEAGKSMTELPENGVSKVLANSNALRLKGLRVSIICYGIFLVLGE